jgi:hypothetical protein
LEKQTDLSTQFRTIDLSQADRVSHDIPRYQKIFAMPKNGYEKSGVSFYRGGDKPFFTSILKDLKDNAAAAAKQIENLQGIPFKVDLPLTLVYTKREDSRGIGSTEQRHNSLTVGGIDSLYAEQAGLKEKGYLPTDFPLLDAAASPWKWENKSYNKLGMKKAQRLESIIQGLGNEDTINTSTQQSIANAIGSKNISNEKITVIKTAYENSNHDWKSLLQFFPQHEVSPALLPQNRIIEATGAVLNERRSWFHNHATKLGFEIQSIDQRIERTWNGIFFAAPGFGKNLMDKYRRTGKELDNILKDKEADRSHYVQIAKQRAAEAELLERSLKK